MSLWYSRHSDNVSALVTPTLQTGTINVLRPITRLIDRDPATATKTTSTGDSRWLWSYPAPQRIDGLWLPMYNSPAGTALRLEGHTSNSWASPLVSVSVTVPPYGGDLPRGLFFNVTAHPAYSDSGLQYWSLLVPNAGIITALGEAFLSRQLRTTRNLLIGIERPRGRRVTRHERADGGSFRYDRGTDTFEARGRVNVNAEEYADYLALFEDARGSFYPFAVVLNPEQATPEGYVMQWVGDFAPANTDVPGPTLDGQRESIPITWQMVPRGRAL